MDLDKLWEEAVKDKPDIVPSEIRVLIQKVRNLELALKLACDEFETNTKIILRECGVTRDYKSYFMPHEYFVMLAEKKNNPQPQSED